MSFALMWKSHCPLYGVETCRTVRTQEGMDLRTPKQIPPSQISWPAPNFTWSCIISLLTWC